MQHILHDLKYNDNQEVGSMIGRWFGHDLLLGGFADSFDLIIPVPLHPDKLKKRGYNQAAAFGWGLSEVLGVPQFEEGLIRNTNIESQTRKSKVRRIQNVDGIFEAADASTLKGARVLLVDDVLTTGSTLIACAEPLINAKAKSVSIAVMAGVK
ncbi:MAG: ComF family protein [Cytophagia bacterium]|nr:ComF family protein [Cytophagia bacterium]